MFRLTVISKNKGSITLGLGGHVNKESLPKLEAAIRAGCAGHHVVLDLSEVTLLDQATARYFGEKMREGVGLVNCPSYIQHWISPHIAHEPEA